MNYLKVYCNLIRKAEKRIIPKGYTEKHHVFPKSIFGNNNRIVVLTAREHYIAHALLEKIYIKRYGLKNKKTFKMIFAYNMMSNVGQYKNSSLYETFKTRFVKNNLGENHPMYGKRHSEKSRMKMSKSHKGKKISSPRSEEHIEKIREANIGKIMDEEVKNKIRKSMLGKKQYIMTDEIRKKKISQSKIGTIPPNKGKSHSEETKEKIRNKKCKYEYIITSPYGIEYKTNNLKMFCNEYTEDYLSYTNMNKLCNDVNYKYKMWKIKKVELIS